MRNKILQAQLDKVPFALCPSSMSALLEMANGEAPRMEGTPRVANDSVIYEKRGSTAIISVDGGMYKKDVGGMCSSVASYDIMVQLIDKAENDVEVETVIYRVDSPGGAVAGADEVEAKIASSKKKTITFYENMGASGAIWIFTASDELYASETTMLGSIGVVVSYMETEDDDRRVEIVSKNAENKRCSLNGDCKEKITTMINVYEDMFYARVTKNTGFSAEKIKTVFNNGDMIFATQAQKEGFIKEVLTFDALLKSISNNIGSTIVPSASIAENTMNNNQGADMAFDRNDLDATEKEFNSLVAENQVFKANRTTMTNRVEVLETKLETSHTALEAKNDEIEKLSAAHDSKLSEAEKGLVDFKAETQTRMEEAVKTGASTETALAMVNADSSEDASKIAIDAKQSTGGSHQGEETKPSAKSAIMAYAEKNKGSIK